MHVWVIQCHTETTYDLPSVVHLSRVAGASVFPPRVNSLTDVTSKTNKSCLQVGRVTSVRETKREEGRYAQVAACEEL